MTTRPSLLIASILSACTFSCGREPAPEPTSAPPTTTSAPDAVASVPTAELDALVAEVKDRQTCNRVTGCPGVEKLVALGGGIVERLADELARSPKADDYWTTMFVDALSQLHDARAVPVLRGYIRDKRWELNFTALRGLGRLAHTMDVATRKAVAADVRARATGPVAAIDTSAAAATAFALARLEPEAKAEHEAALVAMIPKDRAASEAMPAPHLDVVVQLVAEARLTHALPGLRWAALSPNRFVSVHALEALGKLKDTNGVPFALARLEDENPTVRKTAMSALQNITGAKTITTVEGWKKWAAQYGLDQLPAP